MLTCCVSAMGGSKVGRLRACVGLADRFNGLCSALQKCLFGGYCGEGQVPLLRIITVVERVRFRARDCFCPSVVGSCVCLLRLSLVSVSCVCLLCLVSVPSVSCRSSCPEKGVRGQ
eukprot:3633322-Rhodomonas_salina.1